MKKASLSMLLCSLLIVCNVQETQANWFTDLWDGITSLFKPVWGKYTEGGSTNAGPPLTTFKRAEGVYWKERDIIISNISQKGNDKTKFYELYKEIYDNAVTGSVTDPCPNYGVCHLAKTAKDAAFIYLMGFDSAGNELTSSSNPTRSFFYDKAVTILKKWEGVYGGFASFDHQQYRSGELIMLLEAHDYLYTAKAVGQVYTNHDYETVRDRLADFTYELYSEANNYNGSLDRYNNLTLQVAGAIGMAACVLSDKTTYLLSTQKKPERWANAAHAYINRTLWTGPGWIGSTFYQSKGPLAEKGKVSGYAEGPGYFSYGFIQHLLPFFITFQNFTNRDMEGEYYTSSLNFLSEKVRNYVYDPNYDNLYKWYTNTVMPNGRHHPTDDSWVAGYDDVISITGKPEYNIASGSANLQLNNNGREFAEDYLAAHNNPTPLKAPEVIPYTQSGDLIVRTNGNVPLKDAHYLRLSCERGTAVNGYRPLDNGHEHGDATNLSIVGGEDELLIDPAYFGWGNRDYINQSHHHNVITFDGIGPSPRDPAFGSIIDYGPYKHLKVETTYWDRLLGTPTDPIAEVKREVDVHYDVNGVPYYVINDYATNRESNSVNVKFNLNGNGHTADGTLTQVSDNQVIWSYPCIKDSFSDDNWKLRATITINENTWGGNIAAEFDLQNGSKHGTDQIIYRPFRDPVTSKSNEFKFSTSSLINEIGDGTGTWGEHTRAYATYPGLIDYHTVHFQVTLEPIRCPDNPPSPITKQGGLYNAHMVTRGTSGSQSFSIHYSGNAPYILNTVENPFDTDTSENFSCDAKTAFLNYSEDTAFTAGSCVSYTKFRKLSLTEGDSLLWRDTAFVLSNQPLDFLYYELAGKFRYKGTVTAPPGGAHVYIRLPDLEHGYKMVANADGGGALSSTHFPNASWYKIEVDFPAGKTDFVLELEDPCAVSCFFPSTAHTIDSTFDFNTGTLERLAHDLEDVDSIGWLKITNGSKMSICPDFVFYNHDSITMGSCEASLEEDAAKQESVGNTGGDSLYVTTPSPVDRMDALGSQRMYDKKRNMIIVNDRAALVLDSGSQTHVGTSSTLLVRSGGTLFVKAGAMLEIGSECPHDRGELICERGSYVCVEEGADMHFFADIDSTNYLTKLDTFDRHIVYVAMPKPDPLSGDGATLPGSNPSVNVLGARGKFLTDSIYEEHDCEAFCSWKVVNPPYGVNNREFGWCNVSFPASRIRMPDTFCVGEPIFMQGRRTLNETGYKISICTWDTALNACSTSEVVIKNKDTFWIANEPIAPTGLAAGNYRIRLVTWNDCNEKDTAHKYIYVAPLPEVTLNVQDSGCAGFGTVTADGSSSTSGITNRRHRWSVHPIIDDSLTAEDPEREFGGDWGPYDTTVVSSSFNFPNYKWMGGMKHAISLTVIGKCGEVTAWDTVFIPLGAHIIVTNAKTYQNPLGPASFQLNGYAPGAFSYSWTPTTYLDSPYTLHPISTPPGQIEYVFSVTDGICSDYDTVTVLHNQLAFAGVSQQVCHGDSVMLGTAMDGVILLAVFNKTNSTSFNSFYDSMDSLDLKFHKYFTPFLINSYNTYYYSGHPYYVFVNHPEVRKLIHSRNWYANFFRRFVDAGGYWGNAAQTFGEFRTAINWDTEVRSAIDSMYMTYNRSLVESMIRDYRDYVRDREYDQLSTTWEIKHPDSLDWILCDGDNGTRDWQNFINMSDRPDATTMYRLTVIDNSSSVVEYDTAVVYVNDTVSPQFNPTWQIDSTVAFQNTTANTNDHTTYSWTFGDGLSGSTLRNPVHTFAHFDTSFIVCLTVNNECGSFVTCDTISVDSNGWYGLFAKKEQITAIGDKRHAVAGKANGQPVYSNYLSVNRPNPFSHVTVIDYMYSISAKTAVLRITSPLGIQISEQKLVAAAGQLTFDGSTLSDGLYYYSLIVDGVIVNSKAMVIQH
jgi:PKD repeat protein